MKKTLLIAVLVVAGISATAQQNVKKTIDKVNMDLTVKSGEDFYEYACGGWLKTHPLDATHYRNGSFTDLDEQNNNRIRDLIKEYASKKMPQGTVGQKIGSLYRLYMDSVGRNRMGMAPIKPALAKVRAIKDRKQLVRTMFELGAKGYGTAMFHFALDPDMENTDKYTFEVSQGGISLNPEYYTHPNETQKTVILAYKKFCKDVLKMVGNDDASAQKKMEAAFGIETSIAKESYDQVKSRDPKLNTHKMAWSKLLKDYPGIDWVGYCSTYGYPNDIDTVDVYQPEPIHEVEKILASASIESLKAYMELAVIRSSIDLLDDEAANRMFEFMKTVQGAKEQKPRWKRGVTFIQNLLGESIGKLYAAKYFPESSKRQAYQLIRNLQDAFAQRIENNTWMTSATKEKAIEKLRNMKINVGYPDKWEDLEKYVNIDESKSLRENYDAIVQALRKATLEKHWRKPVDKTLMDCYPQVVNAFYNPQFNSINFPAAILQSPFFDADADDALNYGAIGVVIGHEMSHGFDDQGCQFDKDGNLRNWWTAEDKANYDNRTKVLADWFGQQEVQPGLKVNGIKTLGENIGDNGGLNIAFDAFRNLQKQNPEDAKDLNGLTPNQRFFLSYAFIWASNIAPQFVAYIVNSDPHSPNVQRVNAALPMIDAWYDAFHITPADKLFVPAENRAHVW